MKTRYKAYRIVRSKADKDELKIWNKVRKEYSKPRKERNRKNPRSYATYIKSPLWEQKRNEFWRSNKRECQACYSTTFLNIHHAIYTVFDGSEKIKNLFSLCNNCHREFHQIYGSKGNMLNETNAFIEMKKSGF